MTDASAAARSRRGAPIARRAVAASVWIVSWALALAALVMMWAGRLPADPLPGIFLSEAPLEVRSIADDIDVTVALIYGPVAALILARRPHPVGIMLAVYAVGSGIAAFGIQYGLLGLQVPGLPLWGLLSYAGGWAFVPGTFLIAALPLLVTRGRVPRWQRAVVLVCVALAAAALVISMTQQGVPPSPRNPLGIDIPAYQAALPRLYTTLSAAALGISVLSCVVVTARWWRRRSRAGLAWLALGQLFLTLSYIAQALPAALDLPPWVIDFALFTPVLGQILYPAAILVVVLGQRLWGVEIVVSRMLLWALLSFSGVALYLLVVAAAHLLLPAPGGLALVVPVVVALAVLPLRGWLQGRIDRLIYGEGADAAQLLARLGERIGELPPGPDGLTELAETLRRVLRLGWVEIRATGVTARAGRRGDAETTCVPLNSGAERIGELCAQPVAGQRLDRRTLAVLGDVAGLVATVVRLAESYLVLDATRAALVTQRADERRAIRRELHDGLGPALAGAGFGLAAVENLAREQPERAAALLAELAADVQRRVRDVRNLANEVSPRPLDAEDLPEALQRLARRFDSPQLGVRAAVDGAEHLTPEIAEALYFIAAEALANAVRHSGARSIDVTIEATAAAAILVVADDGSGIRADATPGVGMASMRERAAGHGGRLVATGDESGTTVTARLPLASAALIEDA